MQNALAHLERTEAPVAALPTRGSHFDAWYADIAVGGSRTANSISSPREYRTSWNPDLSGSLLVTAGAAGTVLRSQRFGAGGMVVVYDEEPPMDATAMRDYLVSHSGLTDSTDPVQMLDAVAELLVEWTLPPKQQSAILLMLASMSGIEPLGYADDRIGRPGLVFSATSPTPDAAFRSNLVVSAESGSILSLETIYLGGIPDLEAASGSVVRYVVWK